MGNVTPLPKARTVLSPPAPITEEHDVSQFDCEKPPLNDWLRRRALKNDGRASRCFVVCSGRSVVGFYCLSAGSVEHADVPRALKQNMPPLIPVFVFGRMGMDKNHQKQGIGPGLLKDALLRSASAAQEIGARAVLVHAIDRDVIPFYVKYGFQVFPEGSQTLFMPMEQIGAAL
jgi:GNAT superfamily N-acetyltransferase